MSLATLPPELYACILSHVHEFHRRATTLSLSRAIPLSPVPLQPLFERIIISRPEQVDQLHQRLCYHSTSDLVESPGNETPDKTEECALVKSLNIRTSQAKPDTVVNLLALLPEIERLTLWIGTQFSPDNLEDIFRSPVFALDVLSLRFMPYVYQATYYQFLKGSYFDEALRLLTFLPAGPGLSRLSIIHDPLPSASASAEQPTFAQPIIFFSLLPFAKLSISSAMEKATHICFRIPSRQLVPYITTTKISNPNNASRFPSLVYIDLSTCSLRNLSDVEALLIYTGRGRLRHIVLDKTGLCKGSDGEWRSLGRTCALAGVRRMRERESALQKGIETKSTSDTRNQGVSNTEGQLTGVTQYRWPRRGRRGLATPTISIRNLATENSAEPSVISAGKSANGTSENSIRVLPPPPSLRSLSTTLVPPLGSPDPEVMEVHETRAKSDFTEGWMEGLDTLREIWDRLRQSQARGVRIMRFSSDHSDNSGAPMGTDSQGMLQGLVDMGRPGEDHYWEELSEVMPPILCFGGSWEEDDPENDEVGRGHPEGCGHRFSWNAWGDREL